MNTSFTIPANVPEKSPVHGANKIPNSIYQTYITGSVPAGMYEAAMSWINCNPDYSYHFYDDGRCREFIKEHFDNEVLAAFDKVSVGAFKADLWRYCVLFIKGGVYADLDTVCSAPLANLINREDEFISVFAGAVQGGIFNAFICCMPEHPFLKRAIEKSVENIMRDGSGCRHVLEITGPLCLGDSINDLTGRARDTEFLAREYDLAGYRFRILEKVRSNIPSERRVTNGEDTVLMCKYEGYGEDLMQTGGRHWSGRDDI